MRRYMLVEHEAHEDRPVTVTESDLERLERRARWGVTAAWIAGCAIALLLGAALRSEITLRRMQTASAASNAALANDVRQLASELAERTADARIAETAGNAAVAPLERLSGQIAAIAARQRAADQSLGTLGARVDAQATDLANLGTWRSVEDAARADRDARLAKLEAGTQSRAEDVDGRLAALGRKVDSIDKTVAMQGEMERSTRSRQNALLGAVPIFLAPYIHVLDHSGR
ncbi:MAG TPA: hypothetical protein VF363_12505 [Candidatus Eisenbacteria bacterium]